MTERAHLCALFFSFPFVTSRLVDKTAVCQTNKPTMNVDR